jgi:hypothetical protein
MTTNLTAWAYDGNAHSLPNYTLTQGADARKETQPYWCYPDTLFANGTSSAIYDANPHLGLLYNWSAATAGKGEQYRNENNIYEDAMEETTTNEPGKQQRIQGICPSGWHLPSDREWTELEKYIYEHAEDYSSYTAAERQGFPNLGSWDPAWNTARSFRPSYNAVQGHGRAMLSPCPIPPATTATGGLSKTILQGGFSVLLAGLAFDQITGSFGRNAYFWSSSSAGGGRWGSAWSREPQSRRGSVGRHNDGRYRLFSVRCKKD